jgi:HEAT repeat protein
VAPDPIELLRAAVEDGSEAAMAAWVASGVAGLVVLSGFLDGRLRLPEIGSNLHPKDEIDNTSALVAEIAEAHPTAFLDVFADERFDANTYVLTGLGRIDDPRATERLARAADSQDMWARMQAAIGLGRRSSPVATSALGRLLEDPEYLVRYHSLKSLARVGGADALPLLLGYVAHADIERILADEAVAAIESRATGRPAGPSG